MSLNGETLEEVMFQLLGSGHGSRDDHRAGEEAKVLGG